MSQANVLDQTNVPPIKELQTHVDTSLGFVKGVQEKSTSTGGIVLDVADAVDAIVKDHKDIVEGPMEWIEALHAARAISKQINDDVPSKDKETKDSFVMSEIQGKLLPSIPDSSSNEKVNEDFSTLKSRLQGIFSSGVAANADPMSILSQLTGVIARAQNETDDIPDDKTEKIVTDDVIKTLAELYGSHKEMVNTTKDMVDLAQKTIVKQFIEELKKHEAVQELLDDLEKNEVPLDKPSRLRAEIFDEMIEGDRYLEARAAITDAFAKKKDNHTLDARKVLDEEYAQLKLDLDEWVEEEIAKRWDEKNPNAPAKKSDLEKALRTLQKRIEMLAQVLRQTKNIADSVEKSDNYFNSDAIAPLAKANKTPSDLETLLQSAFGIHSNMMKVRAELRAITKGEFSLEGEKLAEAIEKMRFDSPFLDGNTGNGGPTPPPAGQARAQAPAAPGPQVPPVSPAAQTPPPGPQPPAQGASN